MQWYFSLEVDEESFDLSASDGVFFRLEDEQVVLVSEQACRMADVYRCFELVSGEHPHLYLGVSQRLQRASGVVLQLVFHCSRSDDGHRSLQLRRNGVDLR